MTREPWLSYVQHCEPCDVVMVESQVGGLVFSKCPSCMRGPPLGVRGRRIERFQAKVMEASGRYDGHRNHVEGINNPFWVKGSDSQEDTGP